MPTARSAIRRVREALEVSLPETTARAVLFHTLSRWGPQIPATRPDLLRFARGALKDVLSAHLPAEQWVPIIVRVENALAVVDSSDADHPSVHPPPPGSRPVTDVLTTRPLPAIGAAVGVLIVSASPTFADSLELALGAEEVAASTAHSVAEMNDSLTEHVGIVLVDGVDPPEVEPTRLAAALDRLPSDVWRAIWAAELPFGRDVTHALEACGVHCVPFVTSEGIAPFIDLLRSRRPT